jgi:dTDP-4-amino-4,6-dideoxygalactose transaminase
MGEEEKRAVLEVLESGHLSTFSACAGPSFLGGKKIRQFEEDFAAYHGVRFAIAVNSATSGLHVALAAAGVGPGDEVIVPPYTFTATASSVLMHNGVPVFADIDPHTFCLDPTKVATRITRQTKAIIPVHLLGHPAEMNSFTRLAKEHGLRLIEDCAQAPGATYKGSLVGTMGDLGVYSFQETKNIMTGEGGMVITDDEELAERCRMVRNHGEAVVDGKPRAYLANLVGWNYRMTEMEAAVGIGQLKKLDRFNGTRIELSRHLSEKLSKMEGITVPYEHPHVKHVYHVYAMKYDAEAAGLSRDALVAALNAEGIPVGTGYPHPLYRNPIFREKLAYGEKGCPFTCPFYKGRVSYDKGLAPVAEDLCENTALWLFVARPPATKSDMDDIILGFEKVLEDKEKLAFRETGS